MSWQGHLSLNYRRDGTRTVAHDRHSGPLRVLQSLYPEGEGICHHVLVHPPGGIAGGDVLEVDARLDADTHALITTPGATRFYRSAGDTAHQSVHLHLQEGARLEWLPLETLAYRGCRAVNEVHMHLAPGASVIGWDVLALGLPAAGEPFDDPAHAHGFYTQRLSVPGVWLEQGTLRADDRRLLDSPLGLGGRRVSATLWLASGDALPEALRRQLLEQAREILEPRQGGEHRLTAGASSPHEPVVVVRAVADRVEPIMNAFIAVWQQWRPTAWSVPPHAPRVWRT